MTIPLDDPESIATDVVQITTVRAHDDVSFTVNSVEGTGFVPGGGILVTCWHCVAAQPPERCFYGASHRLPGGKYQGAPLSWAS